MFKKLFRKC